MELDEVDARVRVCLVAAVFPPLDAVGATDHVVSEVGVAVRFELAQHAIALVKVPCSVDITLTSVVRLVIGTTKMFAQYLLAKV